MGRYFAAPEPPGPRWRYGEPAENREERRLPAPVRAVHEDRIPRVDGEAHAAQDVGPAIVRFPNVEGFQDWLRHAKSPWSPRVKYVRASPANPELGPRWRIFFVDERLKPPFLDAGPSEGLRMQTQKRFSGAVVLWLVFVMAFAAFLVAAPPAKATHDSVTWADYA